MNNKETAESIYINQWEINSKQHFDDGDYEWVCRLIKPYRNICEIGCGAGFSTFTLAACDHRVLALDNNNHSAIEKTKELLDQYDYDPKAGKTYIDFKESDIWLWQADIIQQNGIAEFIQQLAYARLSVRFYAAEWPRSAGSVHPVKTLCRERIFT